MTKMYTYAHAIKNSYKYAGTLSKLNIQNFNPMDDKTNKKDNGEHLMTSIAIKLPAHLKATLTHYTPTIEEFHVGFEYQRMNGDRWEDAVMNANDFNSSNNSHGDENEFDEKLREADKTIRGVLKLLSHRLLTQNIETIKNHETQEETIDDHALAITQNFA